jgi:hypothetical protein
VTHPDYVADKPEFTLSSHFSQRQTLEKQQQKHTTCEKVSVLENKPQRNLTLHSFPLGKTEP